MARLARQQAGKLPPPHIIGWKEYLDFPEWGVQQLKVKVDTGARTSAIHVAHYELYQKEGEIWAKLALCLERQHPNRLTIVHARVIKLATVTNSGGQRETRPVVETTMRLGPVTKRILLTATNREGMLFRMLLGRKALEGDFLVDVSQSYRLGKRRKHA